MGKIKTYLSILGVSAIVGAGSYAYSAGAEETTTTTTAIVETTTTEQVTTTTQEKITFEYYTITEEAVKNGWTCGTIDRCDSVDSNQIRVYIYDPNVIGQHKLNIIFGVSVRQFDLSLIYVDEYNNHLGVETFTLDNNGEDDSLSSSRVFTISFPNYPPGTKYVKFADITNIIYPE